MLHASALSVLLEFRALTAEGAASHTFAMLKLSWNAGTQNQMQPAGRAWMLCALPVGHPVLLDAHISLHGCEGLELMFVRDDFIKSSVLLTELHCQQPLVEASSEVGALNYLDSVKLGALVARTDIDQIHVNRRDFVWITSDRFTPGRFNAEFNEISLASQSSFLCEFALLCFLRFASFACIASFACFACIASFACFACIADTALLCLLC